MSEELDRAAEQVREALDNLSPMDVASFRFYMSGFHVEGRVDNVIHAIAAAALAGTGWRTIKDAPDKRPEWGARIGRWFMGHWLVQDWPIGCERDDLTPTYRYYLPMPTPPKPETAP